MKITISFQEPEKDQACAAVDKLRCLFPSVRVRTDRKEPYRHTYLTTREARAGKDTHQRILDGESETQKAKKPNGF
mgnify:CR=1 FL=1